MKNKFIFLISILIISCSNNQFLNYTESLNLIGEYDDKELIIIIPNEGCGSCISGTSNYVIDNINKLDSRHLIILLV